MAVAFGKAGRSAAAAGAASAAVRRHRYAVGIGGYGILDQRSKSDGM